MIQIKRTTEKKALLVVKYPLYFLMMPSNFISAGLAKHRLILHNDSFCQFEAQYVWLYVGL